MERYKTNAGPQDHGAPTVDTTRKPQEELQTRTQSSWSLNLKDKADSKRTGLKIACERPVGSDGGDGSQAICRWRRRAGDDDARAAMARGRGWLKVPFPFRFFRLFLFFPS
ncbi:hypothetical protein GW17_00016724 [Ensete ventricosum]|nr:hypothetical protein GW17_00016724 [Ensete ventricosum]